MLYFALAVELQARPPKKSGVDAPRHTEKRQISCNHRRLGLDDVPAT